MSMNKRLRGSAAAVVAVACCSALALAGCGSDDDDSPATATATATATTTTAAGAAATTTSAPDDDGADVKADGMGVAIIGYGAGNTLSDAVIKAAQKEADRIGAKLTSFDGKFNPGVQLKQCQDAISSGKYKVILLGAVSGVAAVPCATAALEAKIPLVQFGTAIGTDNSSVDATVPGVVTSVNTPLDGFTASIAEEAGKACKELDPCNVVELATLQSIPDIENSFQKAFKPLLKANPNMKLVASPEAGFDAGGGTKAMQDVLSKGVDFDVVVSPSSQGILGAVIALDNSGKKLGSGDGEVRIVSAGGEVPMVAAVREKKWWSTSPTLPQTFGTYSVRYGVLAAQGKPVERGYDAQKLAGIPLALNQDNIAEYSDFTGQY